MSQSTLGDRYRLEARIGSGGMAEVYRAVDTVLGRTVAVKVLLPQFARDASFVERFRREAQAAARLNHPNIVATYDHGADDGTQYIVMEFVEGRTLAEFMGSGKHLTPPQAVELAGRVCDALAAAHAQGVIHRDIKPGNIMVTRDGTVKVMDFGIARMTTGPETAPQTSGVLGTASYLSPEQAKGLPVDARSDIYSLGAVLFEMLAGRPPFVGDTPVAVAYKQVNEPPEPPSRFNADVAPSLDAVIMRALSKNPASRYQTAAEFQADLERVRRGQAVEATPLMPAGADATQVISRPSSTQVLPPVEEPPGSGRKVWLGVLIGVVIVAILAGGGYLLANGLAGSKASPSGQLVKVPNVVGKTQADAEAALTSAGFKPTVTTKVSSAKAGTVLEQNPLPGVVLQQGSAVTIVVAQAPKQVSVPAVTTLILADALTALTQAGLKLGTQTPAASDTIPAGTIISQDPPANTMVNKGTAVNVVVSTGPTTVTVPNLVCLPYGNAKAQLQKPNFVVDDGGAAAESSPKP